MLNSVDTKHIELRIMYIMLNNMSFILNLSGSVPLYTSGCMLVLLINAVTGTQSSLAVIVTAQHPTNSK